MAAFWTLLGLAGIAALADWWAVANDDHRLEYVAKPLVLAALVAAVALMPASNVVDPARRWWFLAALACCLAGDVLLMLPRDLFVPGLASFLAGHVLFVVGFLDPGAPQVRSAAGIAIAAAVVVVAGAYPVYRIVRAIAAAGDRLLIGPVMVYVAAIATMAAIAWNVSRPLAAAGATAFLVSDTLLATDRFVRPLRQGTLVVHATYHVAQVLLVLSLVGTHAG